MVETIEFELVSPERLLKSEPVEMVVVPGAEGDLGILPGHSLLIATMRPGVIDIYKEGVVVEKIFISGGFAEVSPERCTVLAENAIPIEHIKKEEAENRLKVANEMLKNAISNSQDDTSTIEKEVKTAKALISAIPRS
jgi:F-type H+-transporting ATPase subunit epsilon